MKLLSDFYDYLLPELPGCTPEFLDIHMVEAARKFCGESLVWRGDFDPVNLVADEATYDLEPDEPKSVAVKVIRLTVNSVVLWDQEWRIGCGRDEPSYHLEAPFSVSEDFTQLTLVDDEIPSAAVTDGLEVYGAMAPSFDADRLPDILLTTHLEAFRKTVLSRLMLMPKKPWSNADLAVEYRAEATSLQHLAAMRVAGQNVRGPLRSRKAYG